MLHKKYYINVLTNYFKLKLDLININNERRLMSH